MTRSADYLSYFAATVLPRAAMFGLMIVLTRWFPVEEYGQFVLVITLGEILDAVLGNWIRIFALRTESARARLRPLRLGRLLTLSAGSALVGAALAGPIALVTVPAEAGAFWLALTAYVAGLTLVRLALLLLQTGDRHRDYAVMESVRAVGIVVTAIAAAGIWSGDFLPTSLALSLTSGTVAAVSLAATLRRLERPRFARVGYAEALRFALPLMGVAVLTWALTWLDRLIINHFIGAAAVGVYAAAYAIGRQPIELLVSPLNTYAFPRLVRAYETEGVAGAARFQSGMLVTIAMLGAGAATCLGLLAEPLSTFLLPPAYHGDVRVLLPAVVVGAVMLVLKYAVFDNTFFVLHRNALQLRAMAIPAFAGVVLGTVLIARFGIAGAGISLVLTTTLALGASVVISRSILPFAWPLARLARIGVSLAAAAAALEGTRHLAAGAIPFVQLMLAGVAFVAVYALALTLLGFSLVEAIRSPWTQGEAGRREGREATRTIPVVMQLVSSLRVGGAERLLIALLRAARETKDVAYVVAIMNDEVDPGLFAELVATSYPVVRLDRPEGHAHPRYLLALRALARRHGVSVVHAHNEGSRVWALALKATLPRLRVAYTLHNPGIVPGHGGAHRLLYRHGIDATVAISTAVRAESEGFGLSRLTEITNGIDLSRIARRGEARVPGPVRILDCARFQADKGQDVLIEALAHLVAAGRDVHLTLAGPLPRDPAFLDGLRALAAARGLAERVRFVHGLTDVTALLLDADVYALSSRSEGFGLALVEAMATGLPVVATRTEGPSETVEDGVSGLLVAPGDAEAMAAALERLIADPALARRLAREAVCRAARFDIRRMRDGYHALYCELAALPPAAPPMHNVLGSEALPQAA